MTQRVHGPRQVAMLVLSFVLVAAAPASRALQPEPQLMADIDDGAVAAPMAAMMGAKFGPPGGPAGAEGRRGGHDGPLLPPFIRLTEQQQDKLFELRHAQEPALHTQFKELRAAHEQLRTLAQADSYDEARAKQIALRAAQASTEIDLMHARLQHAAFALLTPEQRKRFDECKPGADATPARGCMPPR